MAREAILFSAQTLDGYIAKNDGSVSFLEKDNGFILDIDAMFDVLTKNIDTLVMGRTIYDKFINQLSPEEYPYLDFENYIMTDKPGTDTDHIHFEHGDVVELVTRLKKQDSRKNILVIGGSNIVTPLVNSHIIDIYQICIVPVVLGSGIPLFGDGIQTTNFQLHSHRSANNLALLEYRKR
jgi:dihydrofolate reductase